MSKLLDKLRAQRESWLVLDEAKGLHVRVLRPLETELGALRSGIGAEAAAKYVNGWRGFTEATLLGDAIGSSDPIDFEPELWAELVADRMEWLTAVAVRIAESATTHFDKKAASAKN